MAAGCRCDRAGGAPWEAAVFPAERERDEAGTEAQREGRNRERDRDGERSIRDRGGEAERGSGSRGRKVRTGSRMGSRAGTGQHDREGLN